MSSSSAPADSRPTTEAPGSTGVPEISASEAKVELQSLIDRYDSVVAAVLADPRVAGDRDHPAVRDYLSLFTPNNEFSGTVLDFWVEEGSKGHRYLPGPRGVMYESTVRSVEIEDSTNASFLMCSAKSVTIVDAAGSPISGEAGWSAASGIATRTDDRWLLQSLTEESPSFCETSREGDAS